MFSPTLLSLMVTWWCYAIKMAPWPENVCTIPFYCLPRIMSLGHIADDTSHCGFRCAKWVCREIMGCFQQLSRENAPSKRLEFISVICSTTFFCPVYFRILKEINNFYENKLAIRNLNVLLHISFYSFQIWIGISISVQLWPWNHDILFYLVCRWKVRILLQRPWNPATTSR